MLIPYYLLVYVDKCYKRTCVHRLTHSSLSTSSTCLSLKSRTYRGWHQIIRLLLRFFIRFFPIYLYWNIRRQKRHKLTWKKQPNLVNSTKGTLDSTKIHSKVSEFLLGLWEDVPTRRALCRISHACINVQSGRNCDNSVRDALGNQAWLIKGYSKHKLTRNHSMRTTSVTEADSVGTMSQ